MQEILRRSSTNLRRQEARQAEALNNNQRLQATLARTAEGFQPFPPGMSGTPPPPAHDPLLGLPSDSTPAQPTAPVTPGEATRDGVELPAIPG